MLHGSSGPAGDPQGSTCVHQDLPRSAESRSLQTIDPSLKWELLPFSFVIPPSGGVITLLDWWLMQPPYWGSSDE